MTIDPNSGLCWPYVTSEAAQEKVDTCNFLSTTQEAKAKLTIYNDKHADLTENI